MVKTTQSPVSKTPKSRSKTTKAPSVKKSTASKTTKTVKKAVQTRKAIAKKPAKAKSSSPLKTAPKRKTVSSKKTASPIKPVSTNKAALKKPTLKKPTPNKLTAKKPAPNKLTAKKPAPNKTATKPVPTTLKDLYTHVAKLEVRLKRADSVTRKNVKSVETAFHSLRDSLGKDANNHDAALKRRVDDLSHKMTHMVQSAQSSIRSDLQTALESSSQPQIEAALIHAQTRLDNIEATQNKALSKINRHIAAIAQAVDSQLKAQAEEQRAETLKIQQETAQIKEDTVALRQELEASQSTLSSKIEQVETQSAEAFRSIGDRVALLTKELKARSDSLTQNVQEKLESIEVGDQAETELQRRVLEQRIESLEAEQRANEAENERLISTLKTRIESLEYGLQASLSKPGLGTISETASGIIDDNPYNKSVHALFPETGAEQASDILNTPKVSTQSDVPPSIFPSVGMAAASVPVISTLTDTPSETALAVKPEPVHEPAPVDQIIPEDAFTQFVEPATETHHAKNPYAQLIQDNGPQLQPLHTHLAQAQPQTQEQVPQEQIPQEQVPQDRVSSEPTEQVLGEPVEFDPQSYQASPQPQHAIGVTQSPTGFAPISAATDNPYLAAGTENNIPAPSMAEQVVFGAPEAVSPPPFQLEDSQELNPARPPQPQIEGLVDDLQDDDLPYADPAYAENDIQGLGSSRPANFEKIKEKASLPLKIPSLAPQTKRYAALAVGVAAIGLLGGKTLLGYKAKSDELLASSDNARATQPLVVGQNSQGQNSLGQSSDQINKFANVEIQTSEPIGQYQDNTAPRLAPSSDKANSLQSAANAGDAVAQFQLGLSYLQSGRTDEAVRLIRASSDKNQPAAQYRLAKLYEVGEGVEQDLETALVLTQRAARNGNRIAMHDLALYYAEGRGGVATEMETAASWFEKAAKRGVVDSQFNLGVLFESGQGLPQDISEAYVWYAIAASQGDQLARQRLPILGAKLNDDTKLAADKRAAKFKPLKIDENANGIFRNVAWAPNNENVNIAQKDQIKQAQTLLDQLGYDAGGADGSVGPKTRAAIISFERANGLPETGRINAELVDRLSLAAGV